MKTYQETLDYLYSQLPMYQREGKVAFKKDLSNTLKICEVLGQPQQKFKSIHLAGTNGKGSCAHMLASIFQEAGYKTGLYTSPHLIDFRERIKINGKMIPESKVIEFVEDHSSDFEEIKPSFFEWTVGLAFDHFASEEVDIAIIETGLGGRLDSTNVIDPIMSVITNIDWDHMDMLGNTLEAIAIEKAGIIKHSRQTVIGNSSGVKEVFEKKAAEMQAPIQFAEECTLPDEIITDLLGSYQRENLRTVFCCWLELRKEEQNNFLISYPQLLDGLKKIKENTGLRGRWEVLNESPKTIIEVAHNTAGIKLAMEQLSKETFKNLHLVIGVVREKSLDEILKLFPREANYYFCAAKVPRALDVDSLQKAAHSAGLNGESYTSVGEAISAAKQASGPEDLIFIGGSNFVVAEAI